VTRLNDFQASLVLENRARYLSPYFIYVPALFFLQAFEYLHIMSERTIDEEISEFGVATVGTIDSQLVNKLEVGSLDVKHRYLRQTELEWNSECDAVESAFQTVSELAKDIRTILIK